MKPFCTTTFDTCVQTYCTMIDTIFDHTKEIEMIFFSLKSRNISSRDTEEYIECSSSAHERLERTIFAKSLSKAARNLRDSIKTAHPHQTDPNWDMLHVFSRRGGNGHQHNLQWRPLSARPNRQIIGNLEQLTDRLATHAALPLDGPLHTYEIYLVGGEFPFIIRAPDPVLAIKRLHALCPIDKTRLSWSNPRIHQVLPTSLFKEALT